MQTKGQTPNSNKPVDPFEAVSDSIIGQKYRVYCGKSRRAMDAVLRDR